MAILQGLRLFIISTKLDGGSPPFSIKKMPEHHVNDLQCNSYILNTKLFVYVT